MREHPIRAEEELSARVVLSAQLEHGRLGLSAQQWLADGWLSQLGHRLAGSLVSNGNRYVIDAMLRLERVQRLSRHDILELYRRLMGVSGCNHERILEQQQQRQREQTTPTFQKQKINGGKIVKINFWIYFGRKTTDEKTSKLKH